LRKVAPIVLAAIALVAAGCGSSQLSNAAFTSKANAICGALNAKSAQLSGSGGVAALKTEETLLSTSLTKLQALSPPSDRATAFNAFLGEVKHVQALLRQLTSAATARNSAKIASIEAQVPDFESKGRSEATAAGIKSCD
jgi:hypothetical protein